MTAWPTSARHGAADRFRRTAGGPLAQALRAATGRGKPLSAADIDAAFDCFDTEDFRTGYRAFLAKETPKFSGR
jgi:hypothetical protein